MSQPMKRPDLVILVIKPSKYDDDGYVIHHVKGVLPSNTINALKGLLETASEQAGINARVHLYDETVGLVIPERIMKQFRGNRVLVMLAGVQSNQYPRAADLAIRFRKAGAQVVLGGFHVSGCLALLGETPELTAVKAAGVSLFSGEAEGRLEGLLRDALSDNLQSEYKTRDMPDLSLPWNPPVMDDTLAQKYVVGRAGTMDTSRGCIFRCSFCTIIHVQGQTMRFRDPAVIEDHVKRHYPKTRYYFFTDDNMARNPQWPDLFGRLKKLRDEGYDITFMMQVDIPSYRLPGFVEAARDAGCTQVFVGMESLNPENLKHASKGQNQVKSYRQMVEAWHSVDIPVHTSYIIGFPFDDAATVREDMRTLIEVVRPDQASFFMLTPLPGSEDHLNKLNAGEWMGDDLNQYDSFHAVSEHPRMSQDEWNKAYEHAWYNFYSEENAIRILTDASPAYYWQIFKNITWYRYAFHVEKNHPMITGFWRLKGRTERRPCFARESVPRYAMRRLADSWGLVCGMVGMAFMLERIWAATWLNKRRQEWGMRFASSVNSQSAKISGWGRHKRLAPIIATLTTAYLQCGQSVERWKRFWSLLRRGRIWDWRLYWNGLLATIMTPFDWLVRTLLFAANITMEV